MSKITAGDLESLVQLFEAGDWNTLNLKFGESELFLSKVPDQRPSSLSHPTPAVNPQLRKPLIADRPSTKAAPLLGAPKSASEPTGEPIPAGHVVVKAPSLGTFYRAAKPGAAPFVDLGQSVDEDTELCLIEVMKLFTTLRAGVRGTVARICVPDGEMIEVGQPLFVINPNG